MSPFVPDSLPIHDLDHARLLKAVGDPIASLARFDGMLRGMVNPQILLSRIPDQEAVLSSRIEGTRTTVDEVLRHDAGRKTEAANQDDLIEVLNYRSTLRRATEAVQAGPIDLPLILQMHSELMKGARGERNARASCASVRTGSARGPRRWTPLGLCRRPPNRFGLL